jgi:colanic acid/amylovoran biosynthesis glycosyltransferase
MMRIAVIASQFPALSETFVLNQVTGLLDRGADVQVFAANRVPQAAEHPAVARYGLLERTVYGRPAEAAKWRRRMRVGGLVAGALPLMLRSADGVRSALREARGDATTALRFAGTAAGGREFDALCHFGPTGQWGLAMRNMGMLSGRLVTVFHGYDMSRYLRDEGADVYRRLFRDGDLFLPVTEYWRRRLVELGCPASRTIVHRMGVDLAAFPFTLRAVPQRGEVRLLSVARLTEKKGLEYAIRAVARLVREDPRFRYEIVGSGPLEDELGRLIDDLGVSEHVSLAGACPAPEVARRIAAAHVLLAPSVTAGDGNQEGLPVALMEAMAAGLPVVATRHTGIPELVQHRVTGMLADERSVEQLAAAVLELVGTPRLYAAIAAAGRRRVEDEHDVDSLNDRLLELLAGQVEPAASPAARLAAS